MKISSFGFELFAARAPQNGMFINEALLLRRESPSPPHSEKANA